MHCIGFVEVDLPSGSGVDKVFDHIVRDLISKLSANLLKHKLTKDSTRFNQAHKLLGQRRSEVIQGQLDAT
jgi:hypothetical protein